jgi:FtsP/CotA-like multicopper oxidase with cupredoxin domain
VARRSRPRSRPRRRRLSKRSRRTQATAWAKGLALVAGFAGVVAVVVWLGVAWNSSRVPGSFGALELGPVDYGGGPPVAGHENHVVGVSVVSLREPAGHPDVRIRLVAQTAEIRLPSGRRIQALTFDGRVPGPELRVREGDLVEVTLVNRDIREHVSIHWHGVDLPNAEDGVSGVTQNSVPPGGSYVYRFRAPYAGTYWYHSHQQSANEVERGLYGALVVLPRTPAKNADIVALAHTLHGVPLLGDSDREERRHVVAGTPVRLRLINSADVLRRFGLAGTGFRVVGIDGRDKPGGGVLNGVSIPVPAGGRYDLAFTMPQNPVRLAVRGEDVGLVLDPGHGAAPDVHFGAEFDPAIYGTPSAPVPASFDRRFAVNIGRRLGFFEGGLRLNWQWTINGKAFPRMPMYMIRAGETVEFSFSNHSHAAHPMHLHGHHMLIIARDGRPVTPWWSDTLEVDSGERYDVAVFAKNPGIWMFHCHNLPHAAHGLVTHVAYEGVTTPFRMGKSSGNEPE